VIRAPDQEARAPALVKLQNKGGNELRPLSVQVAPCGSGRQFGGLVRAVSSLTEPIVACLVFEVST
jgi:hypothetical protein